jgi:flagellar basal body-associated protein FliL
VTGGNPLIMVLIIGIGIVVYWFVKRQQKKKIEEEVYKTPIEKQLTY